MEVQSKSNILKSTHHWTLSNSRFGKKQKWINSKFENQIVKKMLSPLEIQICYHRSVRGKPFKSALCLQLNAVGIFVYQNEHMHIAFPQHIYFSCVSQYYRAQDNMFFGFSHKQNPLFLPEKYNWLCQNFGIIKSKRGRM